MRKSFIAVLLASLGVLPGCFSPGESTVLEYDSAGKVVKQTKTTEPLVKQLTESTKNKTVIAWESGWMGYISCALANTQDPTPHVKLFAGKADKGMISALPTQQNWSGIAETVLATKQDVNVSLTGISSTTSTGTSSAAATKAAIDASNAPAVTNAVQSTGNTVEATGKTASTTNL